jgi:hypothetical protein
MTPRELAEIEGKPIALRWLGAARMALRDPNDALVRAALETNFRWRDVVDSKKHLAHIANYLERIEKILHLSARYFTEVSLGRARELFGPNIPPAYSMFDDRVFFTPAFAPWNATNETGFGPMCRAAMIVHETVHVFDRRSGEPEIHVSEWDERFETRTALQQLHNPSSYASFTAQIFERRIDWPPDARFGAGNREI